MWSEYDALHDSLSGWLRDVETTLTDYELKATLPEKQAMVDKFKVSRH